MKANVNSIRDKYPFKKLSRGTGLKTQQSTMTTKDSLMLANTQSFGKLVPADLNKTTEVKPKPQAKHLTSKKTKDDSHKEKNKRFSMRTEGSKRSKSNIASQKRSTNKAGKCVNEVLEDSKITSLPETNYSKETKEQTAYSYVRFLNNVDKLVYVLDGEDDDIEDYYADDIFDFFTILNDFCKSQQAKK